MIWKVYSVFDSKVEAFGLPFFMKSKGEAVRAWTEVVNDGKSNVSKYPEDFSMFELGTWDDSSCKFVLNSTPTSIGLAIEFVRKPEFGINAQGNVAPVPVALN